MLCNVCMHAACIKVWKTFLDRDRERERVEEEKKTSKYYRNSNPCSFTAAHTTFYDATLD